MNFCSKYQNITKLGILLKFNNLVLKPDVDRLNYRVSNPLTDHGLVKIRYHRVTKLLNIFYKRCRFQGEKAVPAI